MSRWSRPPRPPQSGAAAPAITQWGDIATTPPECPSGVATCGDRSAALGRMAPPRARRPEAAGSRQRPDWWGVSENGGHAPGGRGGNHSKNSAHRSPAGRAGDPRNADTRSLPHPVGTSRPQTRRTRGAPTAAHGVRRLSRSGPLGRPRRGPTPPGRPETTGRRWRAHSAFRDSRDGTARPAKGDTGRPVHHRLCHGSKRRHGTTDGAGSETPPGDRAGPPGDAPPAASPIPLETAPAGAVPPQLRR